MTLFDKVSEQVRKGQQIAQRGKEMAIRKAEKTLKIERMKMEVSDLKKKKDSKMKAMATKVYELYTQNNLTNPELIGYCQEIKTLQWQIDEKWTEINHLKAEDARG